MIDWGGLLTAGILATAIPVLLGMLIAYSIIAVVLGAFLWTAKSMPDDIALAVIGSGVATGLLLVAGVVVVNTAI